MLYTFGGDVLSSELRLPLRRVTDERKADVVLTIERRPPDLPDPRILETISEGRLTGRRWAFGCTDDGWGMVFGEGCTGRLTSDRRGIHLLARSDAPESWLREVAVNWALTYRLVSLGRWAFHGSAFSTDDARAVAVFGTSGAGKSTVAAAALGIGGRLLADDVVVGHIHGDAVSVQSTASSIKLRDAARDLAKQMPAKRTEVAPDDRIEVELPASATSDVLPLSVLVFLNSGPTPLRRRLGHAEAVQKLLQNSKVNTWVSERHRINEFEAACDIASRVPAIDVCLERRSPFDVDALRTDVAALATGELFDDDDGTVVEILEESGQV